MPTHTLRSQQFLPISLEEAWDFFSSPQNLKEITPAYMGFETLTAPESEKMYAGQIIGYKVKPVLGIKIFWLTEITHVSPLSYFVDEQREGPYAFWHHTHFFRSVPGGVQMTDVVHYRLPFGIFGKLAHWLFVRKQLEGIFSYRYHYLEKRFGSLKAK